MPEADGGKPPRGRLQAESHVSQRFLSDSPPSELGAAERSFDYGRADGGNYEWLLWRVKPPTHSTQGRHAASFIECGKLHPRGCPRKGKYTQAVCGCGGVLVARLAGAVPAACKAARKEGCLAPAMHVNTACSAAAGQRKRTYAGAWKAQSDVDRKSVKGGVSCSSA